MKKITSLFMMAFLLVGTLSFVAAADDDVQIPEPKKVGFFENFGYKMGMAFTFNKEKQIEKRLNMAERRLEEAEILAEDNPEAYERAQERYNELIAEAEEDLADIESDAENAEGSVENMEKIARIQARFEMHRDHADGIYARARERFEENGADAEKLARFEGFHEKAMERGNQMEAKVLEKRENAVRKHKALTEMSDEELETLLTEVESGEGLTEAREARVEHFEDRVEKLEEKGITQTERIKTHLEDGDLTDAQKLMLNNRLKVAEGRMEKVQERSQEMSEQHAANAEANAQRLTDAVQNELSNRQAQA